MKVANIVTSTKNNFPPFFNVVNSMDNIIHGIPTLIIGFDYVNKHYPDFDIMSREVEPNLYWIFKKTEKRDEYEIGLTWFTQKVFYGLFDKVEYCYLDFMIYNKRTIKKIIKKFYAIDFKISYKHNDMVYIYGDNLILGVDLKILRYLNVNSTLILNKIIKKSNYFIEDKDISKSMKTLINDLEDKIRFTPIIYQIVEEITI